MQLQGRVAIITGGGGGIGSAVGRRFAEDGARAVVLVDRDAEAASAAAATLAGPAGTAGTSGDVGWGVGLDVTDEAALRGLVDEVEHRYGPIDVFFSNAGAGADGGVEAGDDAWQQQWDLHVMSHVYAARAVLPGMLARGEGYLLQTASAAGLLLAVGSAPYTVTKAACIKLAEYLAITHGDDGIRVSVLCPQGVNTAMAPQQLADGGTDGIVEPSFVADVVVDAMTAERFFVLPHPEVADYVRRKADDPDRWLAGMRRLRRRSLET